MPGIVISDDAIKKVGESLRDAKKPLKDRFRALFTLKNIANDECVQEISACKLIVYN